jgi:hypothetical protein
MLVKRTTASVQGNALALTSVAKVRPGRLNGIARFVTVDLRGAAYAASRISSTLNGSTKQFGWLQATATRNHSAPISSEYPATIRIDSLQRDLH